MTEKQYEEYKKKKEELIPIKSFLEWCGDRYHGRYNSKPGFKIITKGLRILVKKIGIMDLKSRMSMKYPKNFKRKSCQ